MKLDNNKETTIQISSPFFDQPHKHMLAIVQLIGWKEGEHGLLVNPKEISCLKSIGNLNADADSIYELYKPPSPAMGKGSMWNDCVLSPSRETTQQVLRDSIRKIENVLSSETLN